MKKNPLFALRNRKIDQGISSSAHYSGTRDYYRPNDMFSVALTCMFFTINTITTEIMQIDLQLLINDQLFSCIFFAFHNLSMLWLYWGIASTASSLRLLVHIWANLWARNAQAYWKLAHKFAKYSDIMEFVGRSNWNFTRTHLKWSQKSKIAWIIRIAAVVYATMHNFLRFPYNQLSYR